MNYENPINLLQGAAVDNNELGKVVAHHMAERAVYMERHGNRMVTLTQSKQDLRFIEEIIDSIDNKQVLAAREGLADWRDLLEQKIADLKIEIDK